MSLDLLHLWAQMGSFAKGIVVVMAIMSIYSLTIVFTKLIQLKRGTGILATVGATAPFVGLLGTTMGIVNAFTGMAAQGASGGLAGISAGIAEALITTAFGLLVAIPAVWAYNYFTTKIENLTVEMTYGSKELIDYLIKSVGSEFGRSIFTKEFQAQKAVTGSGQISG